MKALIALLLVAFAFPVDSQTTLPVWGFSYGAQEPSNAYLHDSVYAKLVWSQQGFAMPMIVWDLGKPETPQTLREVGFVGIIDSGVDVELASSNDLQSFYVLQFAATPLFRTVKNSLTVQSVTPQTYVAQFATQFGSARFLAIIRPWENDSAQLNYRGNALIDCAFAYPFVRDTVSDTTAGVSCQVILDNSKPTVWYDLLGHSVGAHPTRTGIYLAQGKKLEVVE